jgi:hypothetical protein
LRLRLRLRIAEIWLPASLKRRRLADLMDVTARAFGIAAPAVPYRSLRDASLALARLTREGASRVASDAAARAESARRLRSGGAALGAKLRSDLGVRTRGDVMRAARLLYWAISIDFRGTVEGDIIISDCSFRSAYTPEICGIVSALDEGVLSGLAGGGRLAFSARLTDGAPACRASFDFPEALP